MPMISESELGQEAGTPCIQCPDYEGSIFLCGEGMLCERCFAELAGMDESELFKPSGEALLDFEVPREKTARVKAKLMHQRGEDGEDQA